MLFYWGEEVQDATCRFCVVLRMDKTRHQVSGEVSVDSIWGQAGQPPPLPPPRRRGLTSQKAVRLLNEAIRRSLCAFSHRTVSPSLFSLIRPEKNCIINIYLKMKVE